MENLLYNYAIIYTEPKFHEMKISASMLVVCVCLSQCLVAYLFTLYSSQFNSDLHQTLHTGMGISPENNWLGFQGHWVKDQS